MPKHSSSKRSSFVLPKKTIRKPPTPKEMEEAKARKARALEREKAAKEEQEAKEKRAAEDAARGPSKKQMKRLARRQKMLEEGKIEQSDLDVKHLLKIKLPVVMALENVQDEVELRNQFHGQGTTGYYSKYFAVSKYKFKYFLAKDGTPVAQIHKTC
eukprot:TRINITY_DN79009_c0_g1_i1.p1 TRINITY_DN79009_c0_g1~~TRINITY_DN79009_c0_g1_i1.p1  ORF type:complete len:157 (-),score=53.97 TRINITY_DN79009_c0_g1_i1:118-588(-)